MKKGIQGPVNKLYWGIEQNAPTTYSTVQYRDGMHGPSTQVQCTVLPPPPDREGVQVPMGPMGTQVQVPMGTMGTQIPVPVVWPTNRHMGTMDKGPGKDIV